MYNTAGDNNMNNIKTNIGLSLRDKREYYGYTRKEVAKLLGVTVSVYSDFELNRRLIPIKHLIQISNFYNCSIDKLLGLTDGDKVINNGELNLKMISQNLKIIRKDNNLNVTELSKKLNIGQNTLYRYERCERTIQTYVCYDIARKFNISVDWLLGRTNNKDI